jgi:pimeloyl-ACP methyl ester carboxylesterase
VSDILAVMDALGVAQARHIAHGFDAWTASMLGLRAGARHPPVRAERRPPVAAAPPRRTAMSAAPETAT